MAQWFLRRILNICAIISIVTPTDTEGHEFNNFKFIPCQKTLRSMQPFICPFLLEKSFKRYHWGFGELFKGIMPRFYDKDCNVAEINESLVGIITATMYRKCWKVLLFLRISKVKYKWQCQWRQIIFFQAIKRCRWVNPTEIRK
jgi:hypothetical protein